MFIWDGTDRSEDDVDAAIVDAVRRMLISSNPQLTMEMRAFVAAISMTLTGRRSSELREPEPFIQGGFTPSEFDRNEMCDQVRQSGRDIVHICFHTLDPYVPTGLIVVIFREDDRIRLHSRCSIVWVDDKRRVILHGVEDATDEQCHFVYHPGEKLRPVSGHMVEFDSEPLLQAASRVQALIRAGTVGDVADEPLEFNLNV